MNKPRFFLAVAIISAIAVCTYFWIFFFRHVESTDNAYVKADNIAISPKINGYVSAVTVKDNESVQAGQMLLKIENSDFATRVIELKAAHESKIAELQILHLQETLQRSQTKQAEASLRAARAQLEKANADFKRDEALAKLGVLARERLENSHSLANIADAIVARAEAELQAARDQLAVSGGKEQQLKANIEQSAATVKRSELDLHDTAIFAPLAGIIGNKSVEVGQYVKAGTHLFSIIPNESVYVIANFKETQIKGMQPRQYATIRVDAFSDAKLYGLVESISPATGSEFSLLPAENATGNFTKIVQRVPVKITILPGQDLSKKIKPGMSVSVSIDTQQAKSPEIVNTSTASLQ